MEPLNIAVFGAGLIGRKHINTILARPDLARLAAVVDPILPAGLSSDWQTPVFADAGEMFAALAPDAVIIATPNNLHLEQGLLCCAHGVHFLVEKPVAPSWQEAVRLVEAVRQSEVHTLVGHHRRYLAQVQEAKRVIGNGELGDLVAASVVWATRKPDAYFDVAWRRSAGGGPLLINAIHEVDLLRYLCGEIVAVRGMKSSRQRNFAVEDTAAALLEFANGCLATLVCSDAGLSPWTIEQGTGENPAFAFTHESAYRIVGSRGSLEVPVLRKWQARIPGQEAWDRPLTGEFLPHPLRDPFEAQLAHFQRVVRTGETPICPVSDGAQTLAATLAIAEDGATGARRLPTLPAGP
jgi:predicted dehydrogenase